MLKYRSSRCKRPAIIVMLLSLPFVVNSLVAAGQQVKQTVEHLLFEERRGARDLFFTCASKCIFAKTESCNSPFTTTVSFRFEWDFRISNYFFSHSLACEASVSARFTLFFALFSTFPTKSLADAFSA